MNSINIENNLRKHTHIHYDYIIGNGKIRNKHYITCICHEQFYLFNLFLHGVLFLYTHVAPVISPSIAITVPSRPAQKVRIQSGVCMYVTFEILGFSLIYLFRYLNSL